jgi:hypothetical protein
VLLFAWLARGVVGEEWREWDDRVEVAVRGGGELRGVASAVTAVGDAGPFAVLVVVVVAGLVVKRRYVDAAALLAVVAGVLAMEGVLKPLFAVARRTCRAAGDRPRVQLPERARVAGGRVLRVPRVGRRRRRVADRVAAGRRGRGVRRSRSRSAGAACTSASTTRRTSSPGRWRPGPG